MELEKVRLKHEEEYTRLQLRCNAELQKIKDQLVDSDNIRGQLHEDLESMQVAFDSTKQELLEKQEQVDKIRNKLESEKSVLESDINKLIHEVDLVGLNKL